MPQSNGETRTLRDYVNHKNGCRADGTWSRMEAGPCACGLAALLASAPADQHAAAPCGFKCADCTIDGEACPTCYRKGWEQRHPNVDIVESSTAQSRVETERIREALALVRSVYVELMQHDKQPWTLQPMRQLIRVSRLFSAAPTPPPDATEPLWTVEQQQRAVALIAKAITDEDGLDGLEGEAFLQDVGAWPQAGEVDRRRFDPAYVRAESMRRTRQAAPPDAERGETARLREALEGIANASRFDRSVFDDDAEFINWAQSIARAALSRPSPAVEETP